MEYTGITDIGLVRKKNEDSFLIDIDRGLFVICDGMGGHKGGDIASNMAIESISKSIANCTKEKLADNLLFAIKTANQAIWEKAINTPEYSEMGTTVTAAIVDGNTLITANVGDSSLFILRNNNLIKITKDHTLAEQMLSDGLLTKENIKENSYNHVLTRALGKNKEVTIDLFITDLLKDDYIIICSDGLTDLLDNQEISNIILNNKSKEVKKIAQKLVDEANKKGGYDNITIILLRI